MELTVQILTKNNANTILQVLRSIEPFNANIIIGDMGSTDSTITLLENNGFSVIRYDENDASVVRNDLFERSCTKLNLYLNPWEVVIQGHDQLHKASGNCYVTVLNDTIATKEIRLFNNGTFVNPVFEYLDAKSTQEIGLVIYTINGPNFEQNLHIIDEWIKNKPLTKEPYYYKSLTLLAQRRYEEFLKVSEHYMFLDKNPSIASAMNRYYFALVQIIHKKRVQPALQNINLCICANPLMAEFWCLQGDVYYHLLRNYLKAKDYYEMAIILGSRRLATDRWPMDVSKYKNYPNKMIESCDYLLDV